MSAYKRLCILAGDPDSRENYFLYCGASDRCYGIKNLLDSFSEFGNENFDLLMCVDGDDHRCVESMVSTHPRVKFPGQLDRSVVLSCRRNGKLLINPRNDGSEFTKYPFPSKVIEYISLGMPVLMYELDGIPDEYYEFCFVIPSGEDGMSAKPLKVLKLSDYELLARGYSTERFIVGNNMPGVQVSKLLDEIKGDRYV
ncbi:glycosyltransferase [Pseudomonas sp. AN3A02]|uniref:glycosyltransferase n=1 Tax=Pseudomonas sp. AN3A02 TaxID=2719587 RepID=UPI0014317968|nr:glycosyltransferase [Pseudomonas sp. AN3A02]NIL15042.1 glycosyltransferase [Pseudomonas sp. AN3A02]